MHKLSRPKDKYYV